MKIKKTVYTFLESIESWNEARFIVCEALPASIVPRRELIVDPLTGAAQVKVSYAPSYVAHVLYLDSALVASIRANNFVLSQEDTYKILYKVGLIKAYREKYPHALRTWEQSGLVCGLLSAEAFAFMLLLKDTPGYSDNLGTNLMKGGLSLGALSAVSYVIDHKTKPVIDEQQDLLDTVRKAHIFAQNAMS